MSNSEKFRFSDFTLDHYREIIVALKQTHIFSTFTNFDENSIFVIKRHDVDFSLENALNLALIESEQGVKSTYFLMLHCEFYNLLEKKNLEIVQRIEGMGHQIGLHFHADFYDISDEKMLNSKIILEKTILENVLEREIRTFSFHNPTPFTMSFQNPSYGSLINCYSRYFQINLGYCSDSNGYWRFDRMIDFIKKNSRRPLQILTHPIWWTKKIDSPKNKILKLIDEQGSKKKILYEEILALGGRENIDWE